MEEYPSKKWKQHKIYKITTLKAIFSRMKMMMKDFFPGRSATNLFFTKFMLNVVIIDHTPLYWYELVKFYAPWPTERLKSDSIVIVVF